MNLESYVSSCIQSSFIFYLELYQFFTICSDANIYLLRRQVLARRRHAGGARHPANAPCTTVYNVSVCTCSHCSSVSASSAAPACGSRCLRGAGTLKVRDTQRTHRTTSPRSHFSGSGDLYSFNNVLSLGYHKVSPTTNIDNKQTKQSKYLNKHPHV